jgi:hypothetical protein
VNIGKFVEALEVVPREPLAPFSDASAMAEVVEPAEGDAAVMATPAQFGSPAGVGRS